MKKNVIFLIYFPLQEILKHLSDCKKGLKYDVTMKVSIVDDIMDIISLVNFSIL